MAQMGEMFKAARENQDITLAEVEEAIHIRRHLLEALEAENYKLFPSPVVLRGLIRNYAKYLNLDPIEALTLYDGKGTVPIKGQRRTPDGGIEFMNMSMAPRSFINWEFIFGVFLGFLIIAGVVYLYMNYGSIIQASVIPATPTKTPRATGISEDSAILLPTITPLPTETSTPIPPTPTPTAIIYTGVRVELVISQPSWVQILVDGEKVFEGVLQVGENPNWSGQQRVAIRAGNGGGINIIVNGLERGPMGTEGQVVDQLWEKVEDASANPPPASLTPTPTVSQ